MEDRQSRSTELIIGIVISLIVIGIAVYWMYSVSIGAVPFMLAFGLPNNLLVNLIILVILAVVAGYAFTMVKSKR